MGLINAICRSLLVLAIGGPALAADQSTASLGNLPPKGPGKSDPAGGGMHSNPPSESDTSATLGKGMGVRAKSPLTHKPNNNAKAAASQIRPPTQAGN